MLRLSGQVEDSYHSLRLVFVERHLSKARRGRPFLACADLLGDLGPSDPTPNTLGDNEFRDFSAGEGGGHRSPSLRRATASAVVQTALARNR